MGISMAILGVPGVGPGAGGGWTVSVTAFTQALVGELITNGNMETGDPPTGWLAGAHAALSSAADERTGGAGSASMDVLEGVSGTSNYAQYNLTGLTGGHWYLGTLWLRNVDTALGCYLQWTDDVNIAAPSTPITGTGWVPVYVIRRLPGVRTTAFFRGRASGDLNQSFRMDDASCSALTLNAHQTMPSADMQVETDVTLPASPFYNSQFNLYYRITGTLESADQFWRARLVRSAANTTWDMTLYLINGATETSKLSIADVGTADGLRVICIGDEHRVYTRESAVWTQRGAPITDATYNDQKGVNTVYTPDVTLTALRGSQPSPF